MNDPTIAPFDVMMMVEKWIEVCMQMCGGDYVLLTEVRQSNAG